MIGRVAKLFLIGLIIPGTFAHAFQVEPIYEGWDSVSRSLAGRVILRTEGRPAAGVTVELCGSGWKQVLASTKTDRMGHFSFEPVIKSKLKSRLYFLRVSAPGLNSYQLSVRLDRHSKKELIIPIADSPAMQFLTVAHLELALSSDPGITDENLAEKISQIRLTERLSRTEEARLSKTLPGRKSQLALLAIADESAFLDPPLSEMPNLPPPSEESRTTLIQRAEDYLLKTVPQLPNFLATRTTNRFWGTSAPVSMSERNRLFPQMVDSPAGQRFENFGTTVDVVGYSHGVEIFANPNDAMKIECKPGELTGDDQFGEILNRLAYEVTHGHVSWSHWENGPAGPLAVFVYDAFFSYNWPRHCPNEMSYLPLGTDFRGEIAVDPASGVILRLTEVAFRKAQTETQPFPLLGKSETMVDYRAVEIGGKNYICPVTSVYIGLGPFFGIDENNLESRSANQSDETVQEGLNDISFSDYRIFRSTSRIVPSR